MTRREWGILLTLAAVHFVNVVDFMILMPLGPFLARGLAFNAAQVGILVSAYTFAAAVSSLLASRWLDRFDRRSALLVLSLGLALSTTACGLSGSFAQLLGARVAAGCFGGPTASLGIAVVADLIEESRRGRALGVVFSGFSVASVAGVPLGIYLATLLGWRFTFFGGAALGLVVAAAARLILPSLPPHPSSGGSRPPLAREGPVRWAWAGVGLIMFSGFCMIPYLPDFLVENRSFPMESLGHCYLAGGLLTFFSMHAAGRLSDRFGPGRVFVLASLAFMLMSGAFLFAPLAGEAVLIGAFSLFMVTGTSRMVAALSLFSRVSTPQRRGEFMAVQNAVQHLGAGLGSFAGSRLITAAPAAPLLGLGNLWLAAAAGMVLSLAAVWRMGKLRKMGLKVRH
jgi:predicted MFS family arabinose efflux permease